MCVGVCMCVHVPVPVCVHVFTGSHKDRGITASYPRGTELQRVNALNSHAQTHTHTQTHLHRHV